MLCTSYGNAYRITKDKQYLPVLRDGAQHLAARFNPKVGAIRSWDFAPWHYPVIIDNMVNLEYLYWAASMFKQPNYTHIASTHALTTMKNHFRKDYSSYHVVDYDAATGKVLAKKTHQGRSDQSAWSRGQAPGLYGYAMCYQHTKDKRFLSQAERIATFIMNNPHTSKDKIPVWDYDVHKVLDPDDLAPNLDIENAKIADFRPYINQWIDFRVDAKMTNDTTGYYKVYARLNGQTDYIINWQISGIKTFNQDIPETNPSGYLNWDLYRPGASETNILADVQTRIVYHDDIWIYNLN